MHPFDRVFEKSARSLAKRTSRRSLLASLGQLLTGAALLPLLPIDRTARAQSPDSPIAKPTADEQNCEYWKFCAIDGFLCACCGGGPHTCPPGTSPSPTSWIGSCINPDDGKTYLIAYRDCCGQDSCGRCTCLGQEGDMPSYRPQVNNDIVWCFGASSMVYHCSSAGLVGLAE